MNNSGIEKYRDGHIHFIGCGGAGMVGLVQIMHELGYPISGSDMISSPNTEFLSAQGIDISIGHSAKNLPDNISPLLVVRSSAVSDSNPEFLRALQLADLTMLRGEMLAKIADLYTTIVAVAGTHGKTSVTALLVHILQSSGLNPGYMVGGKVNTWRQSASAGEGTVFITESDESDGTQVYMNPSLLLITNIEGDHSWTLGGEDVLMQNFAKIANNASAVIYNRSDIPEELLRNHSNAVEIIVKKNIFRDKTDWGEFQKENANIAVEAAVRLGVERIVAECEVRKFPGVLRRMTLHFQSNDALLIEDYAHHPTEVRVAICALRQRFPKHHMRVVFQPHRFARLAKYIDEFADELSKADKVLIAPVFAAWQESGDIDSANLAEKIGKNASIISDQWSVEALDIAESLRPPELIAIFGAGDVEQIIPELILQLER